MEEGTLQKLLKISPEKLADPDLTKLRFKSEWVPSRKAEEILEVPPDSFSNFAHRKKELEGVAFKYEKVGKLKRRYIYVNIGFFRKLKALRKELWLLSHELYYALTEELGLNEAEIAKKMAKLTSEKKQNWYHFINQKMWEFVDDSGLLYNLPGRYIKWLVYGSKIAYDEMKKQGV